MCQSAACHTPQFLFFHEQNNTLMKCYSVDEMALCALPSGEGFERCFVRRRSLSRLSTVCVFLLPVFVDKAPHFSRLGDEEINAGQNATFQCVAAGRAAEAEKFLLEVSFSNDGLQEDAVSLMMT